MVGLISQAAVAKIGFASLRHSSHRFDGGGYGRLVSVRAKQSNRQIGTAVFCRGSRDLAGETLRSFAQSLAQVVLLCLSGLDNKNLGLLVF